MTLDSVPELARRVLHLETLVKRSKPANGLDNAALSKRLSTLESAVKKLSVPAPAKAQAYAKPTATVPKPAERSLALKFASLKEELRQLWTEAHKARIYADATYGRPVFLAAPLTSIWFDGDSFSTKSIDRIDLGALFGVPAGVKAVLVNIALRDSGSAANECLISLSPSPGVGGMTARCSGVANDKFVNACLTVPCDTNGDIWYEITTSGTGTMDIYLQIYGYWL